MGRRRNAASSDESDDDAAAAAAESGGGNKKGGGGGGGGGGKKYVPGMSGKEQKLRAKELRLENVRRKADRDKRNDEQISVAQRRAEAAADDTPPPRSGGKQQQQQPKNNNKHASPLGTPGRGGGGGGIDGSQVRRELRRLFGRVEHGGGVSSPVTGRAVAAADVVVVLLEAAVEERRKSGAEERSQRLNKKGEREMSMAAFVAHGGGGKGKEGSSPAVVGSYSSSPVTSYGGMGTPSGGGGGEPPYHLVRRVVARWGGEAEDEEVLWTNAGDDAAAGQMSGLRISGSGGGGGGSELSGSYGGRAGSYGSYGGGGGGGGGMMNKFDASSSSNSKTPAAFDALSLLPRHCWEDVMSRCEPRGVCRLGATCTALAALARSPQVRQAQHKAMYGRPAPLTADPSAGLRGGGRNPGGAPPVASSPAALEEASARRGWAAVCTSTLLADVWIPRLPRAGLDGEDGGSEDEHENDHENDEDENDDDNDDDDDAGFMFPGDDDDDDDDPGARAAAAKTAAAATTTTSSKGGCVANNNNSNGTGNNNDNNDASDFFFPPCPVPKYAGVGPDTAKFMLANGATAVSCDGDKIKLWFHGGDGQAEAGKRIATLPNPAGTLPNSITALASGPGVFVAGDATGRVTAWDSDTLEVRHARLVGSAVPHVAAGGAAWEAPRVWGAEVGALAVVPSTSGLVAAAGPGGSTVRLLDISVDGGGGVTADIDLRLTRQEAAAAGVVLSHDAYEDDDSDDDRGGGGGGGGVRGFLSPTCGVTSLVVAGVSSGGGGGRFATRGGVGHGAGAPRLWAATTDHQLVAVDLESARVIERMRIPCAEWGGLGGLRMGGVGDTPPTRTTLAVHGNVLVAACGRVAALWDTRVASSAAATPVAMCGGGYSGHGGYSGYCSHGGFGDDDDGMIARAFRDVFEESSALEAVGADYSSCGGGATTVAADDWAMWLAHRGCDGVRLYDMRRAAGPPRRPSDRWHPADVPALRLPPVAVYGAGSGGGRHVPVGCFARGGDGVLVVAPAVAEGGGRVRCSVYTGRGGGGEVV
jgi:hypothetical protein